MFTTRFLHILNIQTYNSFFFLGACRDRLRHQSPMLWDPGKRLLISQWGQGVTPAQEGNYCPSNPLGLVQSLNEVL